jgi:hypothetical protein
MDPTMFPDDASGYIAKRIEFTHKLTKLKRVDFSKPKELAERIDQYFELCMSAGVKPQVTALALALGINRSQLWELKVGYRKKWIENVPQESKDIINIAYSILESIWESLAIDGKTNPVTSIFLGKNNFGYRDQIDIMATAGDSLGELSDPGALEKKYAEMLGLAEDTQEKDK